MILEDITGNRTELSGIDEVTISKTCSGMVVALIGRRDKSKYNVEHIIYPSIPNQEPLPERDDDIYVLLASGIDTTSEMEQWKNGLLAGFINGTIGGPEVYNYSFLIKANRISFQNNQSNISW